MNNRTRIIGSVGLAAIIAMLLVPSANAATVMYTDRTAFQSAVSGLNDETFETVFSSGLTVDFGAFSATASTGGIFSTTNATWVSEGGRAFYAFDGTRPSSIGNIVKFQFDVPITSFGIDINNHSSSMLTVRNNGSLLTTDLTTGQSNLFVGFTDTVSFSEVEIFWNNNQNAVGFDYMQYSSSPVVPVPAAFWLFGSGLIGLVGVARKQGTQK